VLQVVYTLANDEPTIGIGQQYDVFITPVTVAETASDP
jgi:hypothetical protein